MPRATPPSGRPPGPVQPRLVARAVLVCFILSEICITPAEGQFLPSLPLQPVLATPPDILSQKKADVHVGGLEAIQVG